MRSIAVVLGLFLAVSVAGCATIRTNNYEDGSDFRVEDTKQIVIGKTTSVELVQLFGEPYSKTMTGKTLENLHQGDPLPVWIYQYTYGTQRNEYHFIFFLTSMQRKGWFKQLMIVLKDGIVTSYRFTDLPQGGATR